MFTLLLRKMRNTKWMVFCLLTGFIMAAAMTSTIPIYMNASLQRMLIKDMENLQTEKEVYPGTCACIYELPLDISTADQRSETEKVRRIAENNYKMLECPALYDKTYISDEYQVVKSIETENGNSSVRFTLGGMSGIADCAEAVSGRMMQPGRRSDGVYECVASEKSLKDTDHAANTVYEIGPLTGSDARIKIEIVGVIDVKEGCDAYWAEGLDDYKSVIFIDFDALYGEIMDAGAANINKMAVRYALDYPKMNMNAIGTINERIDEARRVCDENKIKFRLPASEIFIDYSARADQLRKTLWLLQIPVILMILVYLFMVSQLNIEQERNEIAVFKSRGASRGQIIRIYALESLILGAIAAAAAPFAGKELCRLLGASNGFLEFVNRKALPITLARDAFIYAGAAVVVFFFTTMAPIIPATKTTIVEHKQSKAKKRRLPLWEKLCADILLLGGSLGWLYYYTNRQQQLAAEGAFERDTSINPMMFIASAAFIVGCGLFVIRIHPLIVRLIAFLFKRILSPAAYVSFNNIGRSASGKERFLMIFLILTVSLGLYFANTARTLNRNATERVTYDIGADAVIAEEWKRSSAGSSDNEEGGSGVIYTEPDIGRFEELAGVESAARVFIREEVNVSCTHMKVPKVSSAKKSNNPFAQTSEESSGRTQDHTDNVTLMAFSPGEFARVCNFEDRLLPVHINNYLEALNKCPQGVILSEAFEKSYGLKLGDTVSLKWGGNKAFDATVISFVRYWPSMNPYETAGDGTYMNFAVMNLDYVRVMTNSEPYRVWLRLKEGALTQELYDSIEASDIKPTLLRVAGQEIISEKNDPMLQGMNGALTLGFIIIMIMCIIGFLIYWILSIKSRTLQFGILRAMGMRYREIIAMIIYEQILTSGAAIIAAIFIGGIASDLYVPLFRYLYTVKEQVPGFVIIPQRADYIKVYMVIAAMLLVSFVILGILIRRINISKALKLGED